MNRGSQWPNKALPRTLAHSSMAGCTGGAQVPVIQDSTSHRDRDARSGLHVNVIQDLDQEHYPGMIIIRLAAYPGRGTRYVLEPHPLPLVRWIFVARFSEADIDADVQEPVLEDPGAVVRLPVEGDEVLALGVDDQVDLVQGLQAFRQAPHRHPGQPPPGARSWSLEKVQVAGMGFRLGPFVQVPALVHAARHQVVAGEVFAVKVPGLAKAQVRLLRRLLRRIAQE